MSIAQTELSIIFDTVFNNVCFESDDQKRIISWLHNFNVDVAIKKSATKSACLQPIWNTVTNVTTKQTISPSILSIDKDLFSSPEKGVDVTKPFVDDLLKVNVYDVNYLLSLCRKYFSTTPFTEYNCLSVYDIIIYNLMLSASTDRYALISGDLSGIQKFLFNIQSKGAAKSLKGRSFYAKLILDTVLYKVKTELGLYDYNVIYDSGGSFYILAPLFDHTQDDIDNLIATILRSVYEEYGLDILIAMDYITVTKDELINSLNDCWGRIFKKRESRKLSPYFNIIADDSSKVFGVYSSSNSDSFSGEKIGAQLQKSDCTVFANEELPFLNDNNSMLLQPCRLGVYVYLTTKHALLRNSASIRSLNTPIRINVFNNLDMDYIDHTTIVCDYYGGNKTPLNSGGEPLTYSDFAEYKTTDLRRLGVLRMDVDNLGSLFRNIPVNRYSLAISGAVSRALDWFFKGYINTLWANHKQSTSIVYSGGDDLFVVGHWEEILTFAKEINSAFVNYTFNSGLSLSGGVALVGAMYPIIRAADESQDEESNAKSFEYRGKSKNSISVMGMPMRWNVEYDLILKKSEQIARLTAADCLDKSFISKVSQYNSNAIYENGTITPLRLVWLVSYDLTRLENRISRDNVEAKSIVEECKLDIATNQFGNVKIDTPYHALQLWAMACRLAELKIR